MNSTQEPISCLYSHLLHLDTASPASSPSALFPPKRRRLAGDLTRQGDQAGGRREQDVAQLIRWYLDVRGPTREALFRGVYAACRFHSRVLAVQLVEEHWAGLLRGVDVRELGVAFQVLLSFVDPQRFRMGDVLVSPLDVLRYSVRYVHVVREGALEEAVGLLQAMREDSAYEHEKQVLYYATAYFCAYRYYREAVGAVAGAAAAAATAAASPLETAAQLFEECLRYSQYRPAACMTMRGCICSAQGDSKQALVWYEQALKLDFEGQVKAAYNAALEYRRLGAERHVAKLGEGLLSVPSLSSDLRREVLILLRRHDELDLQSLDPPSIRDSCYGLLVDGKYAEALRRCEQMLQHRMQGDASLLIYAADAAMHLAPRPDAERALAFLDAAVAQPSLPGPLLGVAHANRALVLLTLGRPEAQAAQSLRLALASDPASPEAHTNLCLVLWRMDQRDSAASVWFSFRNWPFPGTLEQVEQRLAALQADLASGPSPARSLDKAVLSFWKQRLWDKTSMHLNAALQEE